MLTYDQINPELVDALIATEDARYHKHSGIDAQAVIRVAIRTILLGQTSAGGGSTISQQLSKLLFPREDLSSMSSVKRKLKLVNTKFKEWLTAIKLEKSYTKEEIIAMYLNEFDFINGAHGVHSAAETYFGKDQSELNIQEAAMLVGMLKNPSRFNPRRFPEMAQNRRNTVLMQLAKKDKLDKAVYDSLETTSVDMTNFIRSSHITGPAPYLRSELAKELKDIMRRKEYFKPDGTSYNIYRDGLKVYTTIDYEMQVVAEDVMVDHMNTIQERFFTEWKGRGSLDLSR